MLTRISWRVNAGDGTNTHKKTYERIKTEPANKSVYTGMLDIINTHIITKTPIHTDTHAW